MASPSEQVLNSAIFQFGRTQYFAALVEQRKCKRRFGARAATAQASFRSVGEQLAKRFGNPPFDLERKVEQVDRQPCDEMTLLSFEEKVAELTAWADRADSIGD